MQFYDVIKYSLLITSIILQSQNKAVINCRFYPCAATWEVTLSTRKVVPCVRWPATGITVYSL